MGERGRLDVICRRGRHRLSPSHPGPVPDGVPATTERRATPHPDRHLCSRPGARGETTLRAPALSHSLEGDLVRIPDVHDAMVGLFGRYPDLELRAVLDVADDVDLEALPGNVEEALERMEVTTGIRPDTIQITLRFKSAAPERQ